MAPGNRHASSPGPLRPAGEGGRGVPGDGTGGDTGGPLLPAGPGDDDGGPLTRPAPLPAPAAGWLRACSLGGLILARLRRN